MTPKYNTGTRDRRQPEPSPWESAYRSDERYPSQLDYDQQPYPLTQRHNLAARGFAQMFGLHPAMAFLTVVVDTMVFSGDIISGGLLLPVAFGAAIVLGIVTFLFQRKYYGDENDAALVKSLIITLLSAIPSPIPYALFVPAGIVGLFRRKRG